LCTDIFFMTCSERSALRRTQYTDPKLPLPSSFTTSHSSILPIVACGVHPPDGSNPRKLLADTQAPSRVSNIRPSCGHRPPEGTRRGASGPPRSFDGGGATGVQHQDREEQAGELTPPASCNFARRGVRFLDPQRRRGPGYRDSGCGVQRPARYSPAACRALRAAIAVPPKRARYVPGSSAAGRRAAPQAFLVQSRSAPLRRTGP
jgi:hypothetical protein